MLVCDWRILFHFACFCFWMTFTIMIDGSVKCNRKFGFKLHSSHVIQKHYQEKAISSCSKSEVQPKADLFS